jgi:tetratricopeptide (TPR) repeat protein
MKTNAIAVCLAALSLAGCKKFGPSEEEKARTAADNRELKLQPLDPSRERALARPEGGERLRPPEDAIALPHQDPDRVDHLARSRELLNLGEAEGAWIEARRALFHAPSDEDALAAVAKLAEKIGQKQLAVEALRRLSRARPDDAAPLVRAARLLISTGELQEAEKLAREAVCREPENPESYQVAGRAYLAQGELAPAIQMFAQVIELSPNHGYALNNLGFAYLRAGQDDDALDALTRAAELLPQVAYVHNNLGVALERVDRLDEARRAFAKAVDLSPRYLKAQLNAQRLERLASTGETDAREEVEDPCLQPDEAGKE